jgi:hypothetical protein
VSNTRPKKKVAEYGKVKRTLRLRAELDKWMRDYAKDQHTTVSQLVIDYFTDLRKRIENERVEQF